MHKIKCSCVSKNASAREIDLHLLRMNKHRDTESTFICVANRTHVLHSFLHKKHSKQLCYSCGIDGSRGCHLAEATAMLSTFAKAVALTGATPALSKGPQTKTCERREEEEKEEEEEPGEINTFLPSS
jgi:hypothetical protein